MQSVTERVTQIQKTVKDSKFTGLFSPIYTMNIKIGENKKKKQKSLSKFIIKESLNKNWKKHYNTENSNNSNTVNSNNSKNSKITKNSKMLRLKSNSIKLSKAANNFILINRLSNTKYKGYKSNYKLLEFDIKDDSLSNIFKNQKHIVQHQYTLSSKNLNNVIENQKINIITSGKKDPKKLAFSQFSRKNLNNLKTLKVNRPKFRHYKVSDYAPIDYMKRILGTRYKEHEISKEQIKFSKMLINNIETFHYFSNSEFKKNINLFLNKRLNNINTKVKPTKVDLLFYNRTIENNADNKFKAFSKEQTIKRRICSRNVRRRTKTICFTRTLTKSAQQRI